MSNIKNSFNRYEKKYLINEAQYRNLIALIYTKLSYDRYTKYKICNIYYDTDDFYLIGNSVEKPIYKEKLRLRSYGTPGSSDKVYLEIKKKFDGIVYKRRISMDYKYAEKYILSGESYVNLDEYSRMITSKEKRALNQIEREVSLFMKRYELKPVLYLSYDRIAYSGKEDRDLRITFDSNIIWRRDNLKLSAGDFGQLKLSCNNYIMEIKCLGAMPIWLSKALNKLNIYPASYSKYGIIYRDEILGNKYFNPYIKS